MVAVPFLGGYCASVVGHGRGIDTLTPRVCPRVGLIAIAIKVTIKCLCQKCGIILKCHTY